MCSKSGHLLHFIVVVISSSSGSSISTIISIEDISVVISSSSLLLGNITISLCGKSLSSAIAVRRGEQRTPRAKPSGHAEAPCIIEFISSEQHPRPDGTLFSRENRRDQVSLICTSQLGPDARVLAMLHIAFVRKKNTGRRVGVEGSAVPLAASDRPRIITLRLNNLKCLGAIRDNSDN
ncbi:unnamed protein product [Lampetra planeri]